MIVYIVYGQDWVYGRDTHVLGVFDDHTKASEFVAKLERNDTTRKYQYVFEKWNVV